MLFSSALLATSALVSVVFAAPVVHEERSAPPSTWKRSSIAPPSSQIIPLRIGLTQSNLHRIEEELLAVSHPESEFYGQHWNAQQVADFFAPSEEAVRSVKSWLEDAGISQKIRSSASKAWLVVDVTVEEAERLLDAKYASYEHESGVTRLACDRYSVPSHIQEHIELITPTVHFDHPDGRPSPVHAPKTRRGPAPPPAVAVPAVVGAGRQIGSPQSGTLPKLAPEGFTGALSHLGDLFNCANVTTLDCLRVLYGIGFYEPLAADRNSYGIVEYTPQAYVPADLDKFFANYSSDQVGERPKVVSIDNGVVQSTQTGFDFNGESNLDLQYGMGLVSKTPVNLYQVGDLTQGASFNNLLDGLDASFCTSGGGDDPSQDGIYPSNVNCGVAPLSNVISTSYGYNEADLTPAYEQRQCQEYAKLGLQGVTVLYSSGDYGVAGNGGQCIDPATGNYTDGPTGTKFNPSFPATCPYVTAVGATQIKKGGNVLQAEEACESVIYSGGGFSNVFPLPSYQASAVGNYFKNHRPSYTAAQYNNTGATRGFPDLSANGANYIVAIDGKFGLVYGTSASSPVVGAILTLVNDVRIFAGKKPIGFINPTIYSPLFKWGFNDITSGGNQGCGTPGFTAVPGWDPVTGLGTPNFAVLAGLWLALP